MRTLKLIGKRILEILMTLAVFPLSIFLLSCGTMVFAMTLGPFTGWIGPEDFGGCVRMGRKHDKAY